MTRGWRGLKEGKGFWFMTYTAVEKDQNITLRVQCYDDSLPSPVGFLCSCWNMKYHSKPMASWDSQYKLHWTNSNTQDKFRKFYDLSLFPPQVPTTFVSRWSIILPSQIKLWATALILYFVLKTDVSFSDMKKGPKTWKLFSFTAILVGLIEEDTTSRYKLFPDFPELCGRIQDILAWGDRNIYTGFHLGSELRWPMRGISTRGFLYSA